MATKNVQTLVDDIHHLGHEQYLVVEAVRKLVKAIVSPVSEEVKYGGILFTSDVQFGGVFAYKKHVSVEFNKGAQIADEFGHLEGGGKGRRHLKLYTVNDIESKQLARYIPLALEAARADS